jgi:hypothetical protein
MVARLPLAAFLAACLLTPPTVIAASRKAAEPFVSRVPAAPAAHLPPKPAVHATFALHPPPAVIGHKLAPPARAPLTVMSIDGGSVRRR